MYLILYGIIIFFIIIMLREKESLRLIIYFAVFSLLMSVLYFLYHAYDVALAEIAIGSALLPLFFIIALGKQKNFVVVSRVEDAFFSEKEDCPGFKLLKRFTDSFDLTLDVFFEHHVQIKGAFRERNVDLIIVKSHRDGKYVFVMKKSSVLHHKLQRMLQKDPRIRFEVVEEDEIYD